MAKNRSAAGITNIVQYDANRNITFVSGSTTLLTVSSSGALTTTGTITAQTLVVQTVTSSVNFITGSTKFGSLIGNTHQFTGSVSMTGSLAVVTNGTEFQVNSTGVNIGNALTDSHVISGSLTVNPGGLFVSGSGRVGIGTTGPLSLLDVCVLSSGARRLLINYDDSLVTVKSAGSNGAGESLRVWGDNIFFYTGSAGSGGELMRLTNTGRVGIGTTSPSYRLVVNSATDGISAGIAGSTYGIRFDNGGTFSSGMSTIHGVDSTLVGSYQPLRINGSDLRFAVSNGEAARITSGGILLVGGITSTSAYLDGYISVAVPSGTAPASCFKNLESGQFVSSFWNAATSGDNIFVRFVSDSGASIRGTIFYSRSNGVARFDGQAAGTYSDERLKNIKGEMTYGLDTINKIKTYDFDWKRNGNKGFGVKAQEICELIPEIVEKGNDGEIDPMEFQTTDIWKVNYNELVPVLVKAIQELKSQNDSLQQQINELKA